MRKAKAFFIVITLNAGFAYGTSITTNTPNGCDFDYAKAYLFADFVPKEYTCNAGQYLPANNDGCEACLSGHTCTGGTFSFNETDDQGSNFATPISTIVKQGCVNKLLAPADNKSKLYAVFEPKEYVCSIGTYLPANHDGCETCLANSYCAGGTYSFNETLAQGIQSCNGTFAPTGSAVCYPHILHVGNNVVYMRSTKQTTPSLNVKIGNDIFYANMTTTPTKMNKDSSHYFRTQWADNDYYVCDDTTCPVE